MDYQQNRREKNILFLLTKCIGVALALKVFLAEKMWGKGSVFQVIGIYFYFEMREIVFF